MTTLKPLRNPRLPAEWEPQDAIQLTWPHANTDWKSRLDQVIPVYERLVALLSEVCDLLIGAPSGLLDSLGQRFSDLGIDSRRIHLYAVDSNDTWARDHGPITVESDDGLQLLDFQFTGWGNKYPAALDNKITCELYRQGAYPGAEYRCIDLVLEGGAIESDGKGTLLTTEQCLLNPNRNPQLDRGAMEDQLKSMLGVRKINWLRHGALQGDDTDSHVDTLARLCPNNVIAFQACDDPSDSHFQDLRAMAGELELLTAADGHSYRLVALPWPSARFDANDERLPATYANFLVINGMVIVPAYDDANDAIALSQVAKAFPGYRVEGLDCLALIHQHGSLHCITMQLPEGVLTERSGLEGAN